MTIAVGDVIRIVAEWDIPDGTIAQLVYHVFGDFGTTGTDAQMLTAAEGALQTAWANIAANVADSVLGADLEAYKWDFTLNRWDGLGSIPMIGIDGTNVNQMLPHGAAGLVKINTEALRRQARKYVPGLAEDTQDEGTISGAVVTNLALFGLDLDDAFLVGGLTVGFCTFNTDPLSPLFETYSEASGTAGAEAIVAYQRRRRPGTGI